MRVLLSRFLPVGGLSSVLTLSINHLGLKPNLIIKFAVAPTLTYLVKVGMFAHRYQFL